MKKQTAVEWLVEELEKHHTKIDIKNTVAFNQAKAMEKEQIVDAYLQKRGKRSITGVLNCMDEAYQYYNDTFS
jgi:hypothetical protein